MPHIFYWNIVLATLEQDDLGMIGLGKEGVDLWPPPQRGHIAVSLRVELLATKKNFLPLEWASVQFSLNVWEWCADFFDPAYYQRSPVQNPAGPDAGENRVMRGGSFLCHDSYCNRYRVAARASNTPDSASANLGFRCANDA